LGICGYYLAFKRRAVALDNLKHAFPEKNKFEIIIIAKENFAHLGISILEFINLPKWKGRILERVKHSGVENIEVAYKKGKGVILPVSHFGNWEMAGAALAEYGFRVVAVARPLDHAGPDDVINDIREKMGIEVLTKKNAVRGMIDALRDGAIVAILVDQYAGRRGVKVPFFGRPVSMYPTVITVAKRTGASIISGYMIRKTGLSYEGVIEKPLELVDKPTNEETIQFNTEKLSELLENQIRKVPEQWLWCHRRWRKLKDRDGTILSKEDYINGG
jgi:KDO2-lipid IV(A) lauroyltransferase